MDGAKKKTYIPKKVRPCRVCYKPLLATETDYCTKHEHLKDKYPVTQVEVRETTSYQRHTPPVEVVRNQIAAADVVSARHLKRPRPPQAVNTTKERKAKYNTKEYQETKPLTEKELSIIQALYEDETVVAAAKSVGISEGMARWHVRIIKLKLSATTIQGIVTNALRRQLIKL